MSFLINSELYTADDATASCLLARLASWCLKQAEAHSLTLQIKIHGFN